MWEIIIRATIHSAQCQRATGDLTSMHSGANIFLVITTNIFGPETGGRFWSGAAADHCALVDNLTQFGVSTAQAPAPAASCLVII